MTGTTAIWVWDRGFTAMATRANCTSRFHGVAG